MVEKLKILWTIFLVSKYWTLFIYLNPIVVKNLKTYQREYKKYQEITKRTGVNEILSES